MGSGEQGLGFGIKVSYMGFRSVRGLHKGLGTQGVHVRANMKGLFEVESEGFRDFLWALSLKLSDTRVYEPHVRARLGTTAHAAQGFGVWGLG